MTITPALWNLTLYIGGTFKYQLALQNPDGTPIDLTNYTAVFTVRNELEDSDPVLELDTDDGIVIDGPNGVITFTAEADVTAEMEPYNHAVYDLRISSPTDEKDFLINGSLNIRKMATQ